MVRSRPCRGSKEQGCSRGMGKSHHLRELTVVLVKITEELRGDS